MDDRDAGPTEESSTGRVGPWRELSRGLPIVLTAFLGIAFGLATLSVTYTLGLLAEPLEREFGWTRTEIFSAPIFVLGGVVPSALLLGRVVERLGIRRTVILSQLGLSGCFAVLGLARGSLPGWYALYFVMGLVGAGTLPITFGRVLVSRFHSARGFALGIAFCGSGLCALAVPPILGWIVANMGWHAAYATLAILPVAIALPASAAFLPRSFPEPATSRPAFSRAELPPGTGHRAPTLRVLRNYRIWLLAAVFLLLNAAVTGTVANLIPILRAAGQSFEAASSLAGTLGVAVIAARVVIGLLIDRIWAPLVGFACLVPSAIGTLLLIGPHGTGLTMTAIALLGLASGAEFDLNAYLVSRYFPAPAFTRIFSLQYLMLAVGSAPAIRLFGRAFDAYGSYSIALISAASTLAVCGAAFLLLGRYPSVPRTPEI